MTADAPDPSAVAALVLTHRRPRLASGVVRDLLGAERLSPERVLVVVNGDGGLDDSELERSVHVLRLPVNVGPAGGYHRGLLWIHHNLNVRWAYLCEDDIGLFALPSPRLAALVSRVEALTVGVPNEPVGGVVAFGRDQSRWTGATVPHVPANPNGCFEEASVAAWGASLLSMDVVAEGILPDELMFFGYEDFDFWLRMRAAGYRLLVDVAATQAVSLRVSSAGRANAHRGARPLDESEPWRRYYEARNFFVLRRRYGHPGWTLAHAAKTVRRIQLAPDNGHRAAAVKGFFDGLRGVTGRHAGYSRQRGEQG